MNDFIFNDINCANAEIKRLQEKFNEAVSKTETFTACEDRWKGQIKQLKDKLNEMMAALSDATQADFSWCAHCNHLMETVRPGKVQCNVCEENEYLKRCIVGLEAYKRRMELAIGCAETSIADEVIRRKQAEALRVEADKVEAMQHGPECKDEWSITRSMAFVAAATKIREDAATIERGEEKT